MSKSFLAGTPVAKNIDFNLSGLIEAERNLSSAQSKTIEAVHGVVNSACEELDELLIAAMAAGVPASLIAFTEPKLEFDRFELKASAVFHFGFCGSL